MVDKVFEEIRNNMIYDPERWNQIKKQSEELSIHYRDVIEKKRMSGDNVIHFAAYVSSDAMYGMDDVFQLMQKEPERWDPKVVIIPDVSRGYDHQKRVYLKAKEYFINHYGGDVVLDGWDIENDIYIDTTDQFDIIYFANPYDAMAKEVHSIKYAATRDVLPIYINYGFDVGYNTMYSRMKGYELSIVWKYFTETVYSKADCKSLQVAQGKNVILSGYPKMDAYSKYPAKDIGERKRILITPHHLINFEELPLSNFLTYYNLILELPKLFPEMDFVFRPHPLLFFRMVNEGYWTEEQVDDYIKAVEKAGIEYSNGGEYFSIFAKCDAIINDCGSFTMEWLYTGKPGCFVRSEKLKEEHLTTQMKEAIKRYKVAENSEDILSFIKDVSEGKYSGDYEMDDWVKDNIAINYPHAAEKILEEMDILKD